MSDVEILEDATELAELEQRVAGTYIASDLLEDSASELLKLLPHATNNTLGVITIEAIYLKVGLESDADKSEDKDTLFKRFWTGIKNLFWRAVNAVGNFFSRLFGGVDRIERLLQAQLLQLHSLPNDARTVTTRAAHHLVMEGSIQETDLIKGIDELKTLVIGIYDYIGDVGEAAKTAAQHPEQAIDNTPGTAASDSLTTPLIKHLYRQKTTLIRNFNIIGGYSIVTYRDSNLGGLPVIELKRTIIEPIQEITITRDALIKAIEHALVLLNTIRSQKAKVAHSEKAFMDAFRLAEAVLGLDSSRGVIMRNVGRFVIGSRLRKEFGASNVLLMRSSSIAFAVSRALFSVAINFIKA